MELICLAPDSWWGLPRRRYNIMIRLSMSCRVLYIEPFLSRRELFLARATKSISLLSKLPITQINDNLFIASPVYPLPFHRFMLIAKLNEALVWRFLKQSAHELGFLDPVLWVHNLPGSEKALKHFPQAMVCYDVFDKTSAYANFTPQQSQEVEARHIRLSQNADIVLAVSKKLYEDCTQYSRNVYLVPHGVDNSLFNRALLQVKKIPYDIGKIPRPIVGYIGAIYDKVDFELLIHLAHAEPDWSIIMLGPEWVVEHKACLELLKGHKNVYFLGEKRQEELPGYLRAIDVGLLPYRSGYQVPYASSPLKLLEYLAVGIPSIATGFEPSEEFNGVVEVADDRKDFVQKIRQLLAENNSERLIKGIEIARANSWENRVKQIQRILEAHLSDGQSRHYLPV